MNHHFSLRAGLALLTVLGLGAGAPSGALAQSVSVSSQASLGNVRITLNSLLPGSEDAPWIQYNSNRPGAGELVLNSRVNGQFADVFPMPEPLAANPLGLVSPDGASFIAADVVGLRAQATVNTADLTPDADGLSVSSLSSANVSYGGNLNQASMFVDDIVAALIDPTAPVSVNSGANQLFATGNFTLSPRTQLVIEADAVLSFALSGAQAHPEQVFGPGGGWSFGSFASGNAYMGVMRTTPTSPVLDTYENYAAYEQDFNEKYALQQARLSASWSLNDSSEVPLTQSVPLRLTFTNDSDVDLEGTLVMRSYGFANLTQAVGTVPEPGTWALMGLGLVGLMGLARRRAA